MTRPLRLLVSLLLLVATLGVGAPPASAECDSYVPCEPTRTVVMGPERLIRPARPVVTVLVRLFAGPVKPIGKVTLTFKRAKGGFTWTRTFGCRGGQQTYRGPRLNRIGRYDVRARFTPKPNTIARASTDAYTLRVIRPRAVRSRPQP